jgi:hypothetical protein
MIERADEKAGQMGMDVLLIHDERDGLSLYPVHNAGRMYLPKYVLHVAEFAPIKRRRQASRGRRQTESLVLKHLTAGEKKHGHR